MKYIRLSFIKLLSILLILPFLAACDSFLDLHPKGALIPENASDYEKMLNYSQLLKSSDIHSLYMTDDVFVPDKVEDNGFLGFNQLEENSRNLYTFQKEVFSESETDLIWGLTYNRIFYYNVIADEIMNSANATEQEKLSLRAEALVGRAFEYLILVNAYAKHYNPETAATDLAVPLILDEDLNKENLTRATVQQVYEQILKDLDEAAPNLPKKPKHNAFRASRPVGYGLLARLYLYIGDYKKALENANKSLEANNTLLDYKNYNLVEGRYWIGRINLPSRQDNPENTYIRMPPWVFAPSMQVFVSDELIALYDKENKKEMDMRFKLFATHEPMPGFIFPEGQYIWMPYIYGNLAMATPEMYLTAAECEARIGSKDRAMSLINQLRDNRIINNEPLSASNNEEALVKVLEERRRELAMNGFTRFIDLRRLNSDPRFRKTITHIVNGKEYVLEPDSPRYVFPIPREVIKFNPNMPQNKR